MKAYINKWESKRHYPSTIIFGFSTNNASTFQGPSDNLFQYKADVIRLLPTFEKLNSVKVKLIWSLQEPVKTKATVIKNKLLNNAVIDSFNNAASEVYYTQATEKH